MVPIVVVGPGAVGGAIAAHLARVHGEDVSIAARTAFETLELQTPLGSLRSTPAVYTEVRLAGEPRPEWLLVATKTYDAAETASWIGALAGPTTTVAILQNGVEHIERFSPYIAPQQLLPVVVNLPAARLAPGRVRQYGPAELTVPDTVAGRRFSHLFNGTDVHVILTDDFLSAAWAKLALNATGAIPAAALLPLVDLRNAAVQRLVRAVLGESIAVARAEGARLSPDFADEVVSALTLRQGGRPNSLHADRLAGRPTEIDARNGAIVRFGAHHGIQTPVNRVLVDLLSAAESSLGESHDALANG